MNPESLLNLSLVRQMIEDPRVARRARAIDQRWSYERVVPVSMTGFNPYSEAVYYASHSAFARWLRDPAASARDENEGDFLVHEVFFAVHDYLHVWTVKLLQELVPARRFGRGQLEERDLEAFAFMHLVTEAAATVGLDYWYLATLDVNSVVPIGSNHDHLATEYRESDLPEFRRCDPSFEVQTPAFFSQLARFYCSGELHGFDVDDLRRSPKTYRWLRHELSYGATQRRYVRTWLRYLATGECARDSRRDSAAVAIDEPWQERVLAEVGRALWDKVKHDRDVSFTARAADEPWSAPRRERADFRFTNLNVLDDGALAAAAGDEVSASYLAYQLLSRHDYAGVDPEMRRLLAEPVPRRGIGGLIRLCRDLERVAPEAEEPRDLMLLN